jgi:hypothetical protein
MRASPTPSITRHGRRVFGGWARAALPEGVALAAGAIGADADADEDTEADADGRGPRS